METLEQYLASEAAKTREQLKEEQKLDKAQFTKVIKVVGMKVPNKLISQAQQDLRD